MTEKACILVVDDDHDVRMALSEALEDEGYDVESAGNGKVALDLLENKVVPNLIVLDLMMPILNGKDMLFMLRQNEKYHNIPVLVISAGIVDSTISGAQAILRKPVDLNVILETVKKLQNGRDPG